MYNSGQETGDQGFSTIGATDIGSELERVLMSPAIVPGTAPGYQLCKTLYAYHPLGAILAEAPIKRAQGQARIISVPIAGEHRIVARFEAAWNTIGKIGATKIVRNLATLARVYGIASIAVGERGKPSSTPIDYNALDPDALFFNVLDPLTTSGSLVLNQDPNDPTYLKQGTIAVNGQLWHPSRTVAKLNEDPIYILWSNSAFGFVGRSVYQRALYPMKTFVQSMVTDQFVTLKAGLIVAKMEAPGNFIDGLVQRMFGWKRGQIKAGVTSQVLSIGLEESVEALHLENLEPAARFARENCIKNIASAAGMPASIIAQETLTEGFGEGSEDAKKEASYLNDVRDELEPVYAFMDRLVQRIAWTEEFYRSLWTDYPEYAEIPFTTALHDWTRAFTATWPNVLMEPESEKAKAADVQFKSVLGLLEAMGPELDPENKAKLFGWACENVNEREELFASKLDLDVDALQAYLEENKAAAEEAMAAGNTGVEKEPTQPAPFANRA